MYRYLTIQEIAMRRIYSGLLALIVVLSTAPGASAQLFKPKCLPVAPLNCPPVDPYLTPPNMVPNPNVPTPMVDPNNPNPNPNIPQPGQDPLQNAFAQANEGGGASSRSFNESFNGDFGGIFVTRQVQVGSRTVTQNVIVGTTTTTVTTTVPAYRNVVVPLGTRYNGILITDNDSPRPVDRIYFGYNYYNGIGTSFNPGFDRTDMNRQTVGFEKTVLGGNGSIGMRLPFIQTTGASSIAQSNVGDLSILLKYAFYNNLTTGDVASVGMVVTTPTGGGNNVVLSDGTTVPNDVLLQPWLGGVRMFGAGYAQGITSFIVPTDSRDPLLFNNSVALGYFLYQNATDRFINAIIPTLEAHVRTPLNHSNPDDVIFFQNQMNLTAGCHFRTMRATISPAFSLPLVSPQPYNSEFNLMVNIRF
jgi:hypothetical protein